MRPSATTSMRSVEAHQRIVSALITARPAATAELPDAEGRVLVDDVTATVSLPVFDNSAMDGYAVRADEVASATAEHPMKMPVAEDIPAGRTDIPTLEPGTVHRIMTGAPIPAGATAVVPVEATDGLTDIVTINAPSAAGSHIRRAGEDVAAGATVLRGGQVVTPAAVGLAAALGLKELTVIPRQRVLVISTGSELVSPGTPLQAGQIYESNSIMLAAAVRDAGADVVATLTARDDVAQFAALLDRYAAESDLIITSGGVSAGATRSSRTPSAEPAIRGWSSSRWRCSRACRRAPAGWPAPLSSPCPVTRSARWCRSRCSSVRRCARPWGCRLRNGRGDPPCSPRR